MAVAAPSTAETTLPLAFTLIASPGVTSSVSNACGAAGGVAAAAAGVAGASAAVAAAAAAVVAAWGTASTRRTGGATAAACGTIARACGGAAAMGDTSPTRASAIVGVFLRVVVCVLLRMLRDSTLLLLLLLCFVR